MVCFYVSTTMQIGSQLPDVSISVVSLIFRAYLSEQTTEQLASTLKKGGIKDVATFLPANKRDIRSIADILKSEGLPQISEWYIKRQQATITQSLISSIQEMKGQEESPDEASFYCKAKKSGC
jgi:hypothetical protein